MKDGIIALPPAEDVPPMGSGAADITLLMSDSYSEELGSLNSLYEHVSNPGVHIKDKINALLRIQMFFSKSILTNEKLDFDMLAIYRARKEALKDLQRMIEILNNYTAVDNFDVEHPLYNKSLSMIIELILTCVKGNVDTPQFDAIVRDVATSMPGVEARVKRLIEDSTTEDILAMQSNPLMESYKEERNNFELYKRHYTEFQEFMSRQKK